MRISPRCQVAHGADHSTIKCGMAISYRSFCRGRLHYYDERRRDASIYIVRVSCVNANNRCFSESLESQDVGASSALYNCVGPQVRRVPAKTHKAHSFTSQEERGLGGAYAVTAPFPPEADGCGSLVPSLPRGSRQGPEFQRGDGTINSCPHSNVFNSFRNLPPGLLEIMTLWSDTEHRRLVPPPHRSGVE